MSSRAEKHPPLLTLSADAQGILTILTQHAGSDNGQAGRSEDLLRKVQAGVLSLPESDRKVLFTHAAQWLKEGSLPFSFEAFAAIARGCGVPEAKIIGYRVLHKIRAL